MPQDRDTGQAEQQELFPPGSIRLETPIPAPPRSHAPAPLWLQRLSIVILVTFCLYVGVLVFLLPWTRYWSQNHYLLTFSVVGRLMNSGFTRGMVSGLGLLDIWIGLAEIIHYREHPV